MKLSGELVITETEDGFSIYVEIDLDTYWGFGYTIAEAMENLGEEISRDYQ